MSDSPMRNLNPVLTWWKFRNHYVCLCPPRISDQIRPRLLLTHCEYITSPQIYFYQHFVIDSKMIVTYQVVVLYSVSLANKESITNLNNKVKRVNVSCIKWECKGSTNLFHQQLDKWSIYWQYHLVSIAFHKRSDREILFEPRTLCAPHLDTPWISSYLILLNFEECWIHSVLPWKSFTNSEITIRCIIKFGLQVSTSRKGNVDNYFDKVVSRSIMKGLPMIATEIRQINLQWGQKGFLLFNIWPG